MMKKLWVGAIVLFALFGATFAFGIGGVKQGINIEEVSDEIQIQFMKAMHEGNYEAVKSLNEEHGLGGKKVQDMTEERFNKRIEVREAMDEGNYEKALELKQEMKEDMIQEFEEMKQKGELGGKRDFSKHDVGRNHFNELEEN